MNSRDNVHVTVSVHFSTENKMIMWTLNNVWFVYPRRSASVFITIITTTYNNDNENNDDDNNDNNDNDNDDRMNILLESRYPGSWSSH